MITTWWNPSRVTHFCSVLADIFLQNLYPVIMNKKKSIHWDNTHITELWWMMEPENKQVTYLLDFQI